MSYRELIYQSDNGVLSVCDIKITRIAPLLTAVRAVQRYGLYASFAHYPITEECAEL